MHPTSNILTDRIYKFNDFIYEIENCNPMINQPFKNNSLKDDSIIISTPDVIIESIEQIISDFTKLQLNDISTYEMTNCSSNAKTKPKKFIIAIDNDECIGSWGDLSLLYSILLVELGKEPDINIFTNIMLATGCIRPYVKDFFEKLIELKKKNIVYKIFMFTAASNSIGWVHYLSKILENWIGCTLYDGIIHQEMIKKWHILNKSEITNSMGYIKNMNMIRELIDFYDEHDSRDFHVVAIDDRPTNIINGIVIGVSPFKVAVNLFEVIRLFLPEKFDYLVEKYNHVINEAWENYMNNPSIYTNASLDIDILKSMEHIDKIILSNK